VTRVGTYWTQFITERGAGLPGLPESMILIIGYGNPLRGDDAVGWQAAQRLRECPRDGTRVLAVHQLTPELMEPISQASRVIFVDAAAIGEPGWVHRRELSPESGAAAFTHHATPEALLAGAKTLYGRAPEATLISISGLSFEISQQLSAPVQQALDDVVRAIAGL
jgi:hydrogenase maturation protease